MYCEMSRTEFEGIPFRQDADRYVPNERYRSRGDEHGLYIYRGNASGTRPQWDSFTVTLREERQDAR